MDSLYQSPANVDAYKRLRDSLKSPTRPLAFVGAGLSARAGYPTWKELLQRLLSEARKVDRTFSADPWKSWRVEDLTWRAQVFRQMLGDEAYREFLRETFEPKRDREPDACLLRLARLGFQHYLTTNYDTSIEIALDKVGRRPGGSIDWSHTGELLGWLYSLDDPAPPPSVVHVHGRYDRPAGVILADDDYTDRYIRSEQAARNLHVLFATRRMTFVGFSLADAELMYLLRLVKGSASPALKPRHFAVLTISPTGPNGGVVDPNVVEPLERQRLNHLFGVDPIFYVYDEEHTGLEDLLDGLDGNKLGPGARAPKRLGLTPSLASPTPKKPKVPAPSALPIRPIINPDDPQKGRWGGSPEAKHRRLSANVEADEGNDDWFTIELEVRSTDPAQHKLTGDVRFHLHDTFARMTQKVSVRDGVAQLTRYAIGAFTVGAEVDGGQTHLELDLADLPGVPPRFREN